MNTKQRQDILDAIEIFKNLDIETPFKNKYKDVDSFDSIVVADYSIAELFQKTKRAILQLENFLENGDWKVIPSDNVPLVSYNTITLKNTITNIVTYLKTASYEQALPQIKALIYYEIIYNFWDQSVLIDKNINNSKLEILKSRAELIMSHIDAREEIVNSLIEKLENRKTEIEKLIQTKKQELETLKSNQSESNTILANIKNSQTNTTSIQKDIETLQNKATKIVEALNFQQNRINDQINSNDDLISQSKKSLNDFNADAESKISQITSDYESISNYAEEVRKMMGYIADGTLSHSFNKRKEELRKRSNNWSWITIFITLVAIAWVCVVFFYLSANTGSEWANILINGIKSSPMFFLLGFAISQYQKERNLMEEYAFRESVAVTLTSYLEQMPNKEDEDKRKLLISTVEQLYAKPIIATKEYGLLKVDSKDLSETSKILKDLVENLLNKNK